LSCKFEIELRDPAGQRVHVVAQNTVHRASLGEHGNLGTRFRGRFACADRVDFVSHGVMKTHLVPIKQSNGHSTH
ncbi:MAG: hypothetical protein VX300_06465, partial [Acidobacteriota bacterium]|nr:hypothetical protein [Acidobacteriota bacterium]